MESQVNQMKLRKKNTQNPPDIWCVLIMFERIMFVVSIHCDNCISVIELGAFLTHC